MFMRFRGGGVGHKSTCEATQCLLSDHEDLDKRPFTLECECGPFEGTDGDDVPVTTVTIPTPVRPIPTYLRHSRVIRMPLPNPLAPSRANSRLSNAPPNTLTPLRLVDAFPTRRSFDLSFPHIKSIPDIHTHSRPDAIQPSLSCVKSNPDVSSVSRLRSGEARSRTSLARCVLVRLSSLSIYMFLSCLLYVPLSHHSLPSFRFSVSSSVPRLHPPSFHLSLFYPSVDPTLLFRTFLTTHSQLFRSS